MQHQHLIAVLFACLASTASAEGLRLSEPVEETPDYQVFGSSMANKSAGDPLSSIIARAHLLDGNEVRVSTGISKVCQKKGCFFIATEGEHWARISFRDYGFFVPTDSAGKEVTLEGVLSSRTLSADEAAHYAADLGETAPGLSAPQIEYSIVASSVLIRNDPPPGD